jgi:hypothetical protein
VRRLLIHHAFSVSIYSCPSYKCLRLEQKAYCFKLFSFLGNSTLSMVTLQELSTYHANCWAHLPLYAQIMLEKLVNMYYIEEESPSSTFCIFFPRLLQIQFGHQVSINVHAAVFVIESAEACLLCVIEKQDGLTMVRFHSW